MKDMILIQGNHLEFGISVCCEHGLLGVHDREYLADSKTNEHTLTVSTLDSFIACKH